jgi:hypothetical protein
MTRRYTSEIGIIIGPQQDIPAPDVNTNPQIMAWMMDTYSMNTGTTATGVVTGKPIHLGGSLGRVKATGRGVFVTGREAARRINLDLIGARVAVQGFGNVGSAAAELFAQAGSKIVAAQDHTGSIFNDNGFDMAELIPTSRQYGGVGGFKGAEATGQRGVLGHTLRHPHPGRAGRPDHGRARAPHQGQAGARRRQRPHAAVGRRHPRRARRAGRARRDLQRRRRDGELLRMGAGLQQLLLDRRRDQPAPGQDHDRRAQEDLGHRRPPQASRCAPPPLPWPASASSRRAKSAGCTPDWQPLSRSPCVMAVHGLVSGNMFAALKSRLKGGPRGWWRCCPTARRPATTA